MALHAETSGLSPEGAPLVLLHGFGGLAMMWREIAVALGAELPVIAYDLPGHGHSLDVEAGGAGRMARTSTPPRSPPIPQRKRPRRSGQPSRP